MDQDTISSYYFLIKFQSIDILIQIFIILFDRIQQKIQINTTISSHRKICDKSIVDKEKA